MLSSSNDVKADLDNTDASSSAASSLLLADVGLVEIKQEKDDDGNVIATPPLTSSQQHGVTAPNAMMDTFASKVKKRVGRIPSKLKIKLPHTTSFNKTLKQAAQRKLLSGGSSSKQGGVGGVGGAMVPRGRPPKDQAKLMARQNLMRQLNKIKTSCGQRKRGRPLGSKNKVKRVSKLSLRNRSPSPMLMTNEVTSRPSTSSSAAVAAHLLSSSAAGQCGDLASTASVCPTTPVIRKTAVKKPCSLPNGHYSSDSALSPASANSSRRVSPQMSPAAHWRKTPDRLSLPGSPPAPELEMKAFWRPAPTAKPLLDNVLITDVSSNSLTVTIRECSTPAGFFRDSAASGDT